MYTYTHAHAHSHTHTHIHTHTHTHTHTGPKDRRRNGAHTLEEQKLQKIPAANAFKLYEPIRKVTG